VYIGASCVIKNNVLMG